MYFPLNIKYSLAMSILSTKKLILSATQAMMRPAIRILVRNGVSYAEFSRICKSLFVDTCANDFGIRGRPTNISRISLLTGIDRKEVKRLKDLSNPALEAAAHANQDRLSRVLTGWHQDALYIDANGTPLELPIESDQHPNFSQLIKTYGGDIPLSALKKELLASGCIEEKSDGTIKALRRVYIPNSCDPQAFVRSSSVSTELLDTIFHNLYTAGDTKKVPLRFERRVFNNRIPIEHIDAYTDYVNTRAQALFDDIDAWLSQHECPEEDLKNKRVSRLGLGAYLIQKESANKNLGSE